MGSRRAYGRGPAPWLTRYYTLRAIVAIAWIAAALATRGGEVAAATALLVAYPAWDALASLIDGWRTGGLKRNRAQTINMLVSTAVAIAILLAAPDMRRIMSWFGIWAIVAGMLQLAAALPRWTNAMAQWIIVVSGIQSAIFGGLFLVRSQWGPEAEMDAFIRYAAFGAFYFAVSALWLASRNRRTGQ